MQKLYKSERVQNNSWWDIDTHFLLGGPWSYKCIIECCRSLLGSVCFHMHLTNVICCLSSFAVFAIFRASNPWF